MVLILDLLILSYFGHVLYPTLPCPDGPPTPWFGANGDSITTIVRLPLCLRDVPPSFFHKSTYVRIWGRTGRRLIDMNEQPAVCLSLWSCIITFVSNTTYDHQLHMLHKWTRSTPEIEVAGNSKWYSTQTESDFKNQFKQFGSNTHSFKRCNHISKFAQPLSQLIACKL